MLGKIAITIFTTFVAAVRACDPPNGFMPGNPFSSPPQSSTFAYNQAVDVEWTVPYTGSEVTLLVYYGCPQSQDGAPVNNDHCQGHVDLKGGLPEQNGTYTFTPTCDMLPQGGAKDSYGLFLINENPCWISWLMFSMSGNCDGSDATTATGSSPSSAAAPSAGVPASSNASAVSSVATSSAAAPSSAAASPPATPTTNAAVGAATTTTTVRQTMYVMTAPAGVIPAGMTVITAILEVPASSAVARRAVSTTMPVSGAMEKWSVGGRELLVSCCAMAWLLSQFLLL